MKYLLMVCLQRKYNWCGQKGKKPFGTLKLAGVVCSEFMLVLKDYARIFEVYGRLEN
jgi:hypothetical protein